MEPSDHVIKGFRTAVVGVNDSPHAEVRYHRDIEFTHAFHLLGLPPSSHHLNETLKVTHDEENFNGLQFSQDLKVLAGNPESLTVRDDVSQGIELRILPLGASITAGQGSSDGNGYREYLQQDLTGTTMQYVGSLRSGSMAGNYHEGHSGYTITLVASFRIDVPPLES
ncbi:MAG: hypothetical protein Q9207_006304 [Kuettlingeria erythrocarpa]